MTSVCILIENIIVMHYIKFSIPILSDVMPKDFNCKYYNDTLLYYMYHCYCYRYTKSNALYFNKMNAPIFNLSSSTNLNTNIKHRILEIFDTIQSQL